VYAAGSLRAPLTDLAREFESATGNSVTLTFGASGLLRDRIDSGERVDVFASANMEHPQSLATLGWASRVERFARNRMCVLAAPNIEITTETALTTMLDPRVKVGTSRSRHAKRFRRCGSSSFLRRWASPLIMAWPCDTTR
jgi:molybdenum ABC transporter molybdate-binding protein